MDWASSSTVLRRLAPYATPREAGFSPRRPPRIGHTSRERTTAVGVPAIALARFTHVSLVDSKGVRDENQTQHFA